MGTDQLDGDRFPDGRYQSKDGKTAVIVVRSGILATDLTKGQECLAKINEAIAKVNPAKHDPAVKTGLSGDLGVGIAEVKLIKSDLTEIGLLGVGLVLGIVLLYYLRLRTTVAMSLTIGVGIAWTFGVTQLLVGHLNIATGFMFTIIAGNGINFSIIFMDRYLEERRAGVAVREAITRSAVATWQPTLTAALSAGAAYGALVVTEFKGFKEFGYIGGLGMLICWVATFAALPSILVVMEKLTPLDAPLPKWLGPVGKRIEAGIPFGKPFASVVNRWPGLIAAVSVALTVAGAVLTALYASSDPMEYDTNKIQSDRSKNAEVHRLMGVGIHTTGYIGLDGMAILVDRLDQVAPLKKALEARRDAAPADQKPFKSVYSLLDFVPADQDAKIPLLQQLKKRVLRARELGVVSDKDWGQLGPYLPPDDLKPFGIAELPEAVARLFTENDGTRGRVVYISPLDKPDDITSDAHYLLRWADSFRRTELPDQSVVLGSGRAVIYADMWDAVIADIPKAILVSFLATLAIVALAFRRGGATLRVLFTMLAGLLWMVGLLAAAKVKLNFLNFIALPLTFGIGVDYAVNMTQRDLELGDSIEVLKKTGGAVILCSLTTWLGYLALVGSINFGVRSMGTSAVLGEITCLFSAILGLPAVTTWWRRRKAGTGKAASANATGETTPSGTVAPGAQ
ncbi:MAG: MMPL family transporter [Myxococcales bacterium]